MLSLKILRPWLLLSLCALATASAALAQEGEACRSLCSSEKVQCSKSNGSKAWLGTATLFLHDSLSRWRTRSGTLTDSSQWLQERSDNDSERKSATQELQQQCKNQFMQCAQACTASTVPAAPSSSPQPQ